MVNAVEEGLWDVVWLSVLWPEGSACPPCQVPQNSHTPNPSSLAATCLPATLQSDIRKVFNGCRNNHIIDPQVGKDQKAHPQHVGAWAQSPPLIMGILWYLTSPRPRLPHLRNGKKNGTDVTGL